MTIDVAADRPTPFPWGPVSSVAALVLLHLTVVAWHMGAFPAGGHVIHGAGLIAGRADDEPWRLVTSLFLHVDPRHALGNGVAMLVFAVPLLTYLGYVRTALIYVAAGIGGGLAAVSFTPDNVVILGSSGAVAGLFGAWVFVRVRSAAYSPIPWPGRVKAIGIGMLMLLFLLSPVSRSGHPVSVSAHLGGMATGMLIGGLISSRLLPRDERTFEEEDDEDDEEAAWN